MEWSKLKNIILLILLCTNAALLAMVLGQNWRESSALRQARADAIALLRQEGTQVEDDVVPQKTELTLLRAERDQAEEEKLARALLGDELAAQDRGGGVYLYRSNLGEIQFHSDGAFQASFQPNAFSLNGEGPEQLAQRIAEQLAFTGQVVQAQNPVRGQFRAAAAAVERRARVQSPDDAGVQFRRTDGDRGGAAAVRHAPAAGGGGALPRFGAGALFRGDERPGRRMQQHR